ncbi:MAG: TonB family protein [Hyphomonadaceae bacterium]|nr:TonB family protein [Hyphomonadaceae bacterium]
MNDGVQSPEQAVRSLRIVRLVSFVAAIALACLVLLGVAMLRYAPLWPPTEAPPIAIVSEIEREQPAQTMRVAPPPRAPEREAAPQETPMALPPQQSAEQSEPVTITDPVWVERPRNPERFYPREAFMRGIAGQVVLDCDVDVEGRLTCVVVSEMPAGNGFGEAALRIANAHVMRPATRNGAPTRARYRMIVPFSSGE